jgi:hypothetical protein
VRTHADTSTILAWLIDEGYDVVTFMANVGQIEVSVRRTRRAQPAEGRRLAGRAECLAGCPCLGGERRLRACEARALAHCTWRKDRASPWRQNSRPPLAQDFEVARNKALKCGAKEFILEVSLLLSHRTCAVPDCSHRTCVASSSRSSSTPPCK